MSDTELLASLLPSHQHTPYVLVVVLVLVVLAGVLLIMRYRRLRRRKVRGEDSASSLRPGPLWDHWRSKLRHKA